MNFSDLDIRCLGVGSIIQRNVDSIQVDFEIKIRLSWGYFTVWIKYIQHYCGEFVYFFDLK
jgi:hypothetical protein